jgi:hypothetical protein
MGDTFEFGPGGKLTQARFEVIPEGKGLCADCRQRPPILRLSVCADCLKVRVRARAGIGPSKPHYQDQG